MLEHVAGDGGRVTIGMLADLVRGLSGGAFAAATPEGKKGKGKSKEKMSLDLDEVAGGKITMNKNVRTESIFSVSRAATHTDVEGISQIGC